MRSPLALHLPDADELKDNEIKAALDLKPAAMLVLLYAQWDADKGVAEQTSNLVRALGHDRLYVRFHADPHPPGYAKKIGGPEAWGRLCSQRMTQYYQPLADAGVQLHAILANETDADYEGGLSVQQASEFYRRCMTEYAAKRPQDVLHVPAPTGAPQTHREHLEQYRADGWVQPHWWIDGHGYNGDLENVVNVLHEVFPGHEYVITETNNLDDFGWPISLLEQGRAQDIVYFILNWARGGAGRTQPPSADDAEKQMSLMRHPARYAQFKATVSAPAPIPAPEPEPAPMPTSDPWLYWTPEALASLIQCPLDAVRDNWPRLVEQFGHVAVQTGQDIFLARDTLVALASTIPIETAHRFQPIHEYRNADGSIPSYWHTYDGGAEYHGRGFIQNTHKYNYADLGPKIAALWGAGPNDFDFVARPDDLLDPDLSAAAAAIYFRDHGREDGDGIPEAAARGDWRAVRKLVQGGDAALSELISYATALGGTMVPPVDDTTAYSVNVPDSVVLQANNWSCAVRSTYAALWAMSQVAQGEPVTYGDGGENDVYEWMVPGLADASVGLHDGTGAELAAMLRSHGYDAQSVYPCTIEQVREWAGKEPVLIGGAGWYHWAYVRGKHADGGLILENPSPGHDGITDYIRDSWGRLGPWAAVFIGPGQAVEPEVPATLPTYDDLANLEGVAYHDAGVVIPALLGAKASGDWSQVDAVVSFLRENDPHRAA